MDTLEAASTAEHAMIERAKRTGTPLSGSIELLPLCNMNCDMCYVRLSKQEMDAQGRMRSGAEWLRLGAEMAKAGTLFLLLTGGEPLLHPDFKEIYLGLKRLGMILTINTNATLIDESWADFFGKYKPRRINITLYGADAGAYENLCHYRPGFDRVINAVKLLKDRGVDVKLSSSLTPANREDITDMLRIGEELGVPMRMDSYMMPACRERNKPFSQQNRLMPEEAAAARLEALRGEMGEELFSQYRAQSLEQIDAFVPGEKAPCAVSCQAGRSSFTVNWQGMLRPCVVMSEPQVSVFDLGFAEAWRTIRERFGEVTYCAECSVCSLRHLCRVCAAATLLETGDYMGKPEYLCRYAAETARLLRQMGEDSHE